MIRDEYPEEFLELLGFVKGKRARIVIDHILEHGFITTEELEVKYGYKHPPRAARDVREQGIPLETFQAKNAEGRVIAAYRFGDLSNIQRDKLGGRKIFSKKFKRGLVEKSGAKCFICLEEYEGRYLQVDHRTPYEISGDFDGAERSPEDYMLLCGSCNRAKSWSCEHCANWLEEKSPEICSSCYWAHPESYKHIALRPIRRLDLVWTGHEVEVYERLRQRVEMMHDSLPDYVKSVIQRHLEEE